MGSNKGCVALYPSLENTIVEQEQKHQQQQQTRPPPLALFSPDKPSWNLGLGSCFGAIHRLSWSDLWGIKFVHCQSPFLPGANTSDIGAKAKEEAENGLSAAGSPDHRRDPERRCVQGLLLKLGETKIDAEQRQHRDLTDSDGSFYSSQYIDALGDAFWICTF